MSIAIQDEIKVFENEPEDLEESNDELDGNRGSFDLEQVPQGQRTRRSSIFTITSIGHYAHQATNEVVHTVGQLQHEASKVCRIPITISSRNFQNVKLRLEFVEKSFYRHSDFT